MKVGDLVRFIPHQVSGVPLFEGPNDPRIKVGIYLGEKCFDKKYTCSMVHFWDDPPAVKQPRPVQSDLLHSLDAPMPSYVKQGVSHAGR